MLCGLEKGLLILWEGLKDLTAEAVQGAALPLEGIDHIHGGDSLPLGVFGVGDSIPDDVLKEDLEDTTGLLIDEARDTLDTTTTCQTTDGGLGDALDVVAKHLAVTLGSTLSKTLTTFTAARHVAELYCERLKTNWVAVWEDNRCDADDAVEAWRLYGAKLQASQTPMDRCAAIGVDRSAKVTWLEGKLLLRSTALDATLQCVHAAFRSP